MTHNGFNSFSFEFLSRVTKDSYADFEQDFISIKANLAEPNFWKSHVRDENTVRKCHWNCIDIPFQKLFHENFKRLGDTDISMFETMIKCSLALSEYCLNSGGQDSTFTRQEQAMLLLTLFRMKILKQSESGFDCANQDVELDDIWNKEIFHFADFFISHLVVSNHASSLSSLISMLWNQYITPLIISALKFEDEVRLEDNMVSDPMYEVTFVLYIIMRQLNGPDVDNSFLYLISFLIPLVQDPAEKRRYFALLSMEHCIEITSPSLVKSNQEGIAGCLVKGLNWRNIETLEVNFRCVVQLLNIINPPADAEFLFRKPSETWKSTFESMLNCVFALMDLGNQEQQMAVPNMFLRVLSASKGRIIAYLKVVIPFLCRTIERNTWFAADLNDLTIMDAAFDTLDDLIKISWPRIHHHLGDILSCLLTLEYTLSLSTNAVRLHCQHRVLNSMLLLRRCRCEKMFDETIEETLHFSVQRNDLSRIADLCKAFQLMVDNKPSNVDGITFGAWEGLFTS